MENLKEDDLSPVVIDLTNGDKLDESFLRMFGFWSKKILQHMFGGMGPSIDVSKFQIKGSRSDVSSFAKAIGSEKKYMDSIKSFGLDNPKTFKNKSKLNRATKDFTRKTGLKWPFK